MHALSAGEKPTILVVDDSADNLTLVSNLLKTDYRVRVATSGERALKIALSAGPPDLILLDVVMPGMDGYEVCRQLRSSALTLHIPIIFLTAKTGVEDERKGLALGASDYIAKPISPPILEARVRTHLAAKAYADFLTDKATYLEDEVQRRTREISAIQDVTVLAMAALAETRDLETGNHIRRTQHYVKALATALRTHPRFASYLSEERIETLYKSAPLHDIGKVGIPDRILLKMGRFEPHEFEIMKTHTTLGRDAIQAAEDSLGIRMEFLSVAKEIAYGHQEKWDGSGYPQGLAGDAIPIAARIMALADVYDALISRRIYKEPMPHEAAMALIVRGRGYHFDPDMVDAFVTIQDTILDIANRYADSDVDLAAKRKRVEALRS